MRDITGKKFNYLTAIKYLYTKHNSEYWLFSCVCGKSKSISKSNVLARNNPVKSCGCWKRKFLSFKNKKNAIHGMSNTKFHTSWLHIIARCSNKNRKDYKNYGGRGIKICKRWMDFLNFKEDMYTGYLSHVKEFGKKDTSIDRIDNDGNYTKKNCRWATNVEQGNNKSNNRILTYSGKTRTLSQWSNIVGISCEVLWYRILKANWSIKKALTTQLR